MWAIVTAATVIELLLKWIGVVQDYYVDDWLALMNALMINWWAILG